MKITALIVTYNRKELLRSCIQALLSQSRQPDKILVIDNHSTDGTARYIADLVQSHRCGSLMPEIQYIRSSKNTGGSGGFSYGVSRAFRDGADFVWGMDDDALPQNNALSELMKACRELRGPACLWSNCRGEDVNNAPHRVSNWTFVGFFVPREVMKRAGVPRKDFFIYWDDVEYAARIQAKGFSIYQVPSSVILHKEGSLDYYPARYLGFIKLTWLRMDDWRLYYFTRNRILMYPWYNPRRLYVECFEMPLNRFKVSFFHTGQEHVFRKAWLDGHLKISGKTVEPGEAF